MTSRTAPMPRRSALPRRALFGSDARFNRVEKAHSSTTCWPTRRVLLPFILIGFAAQLVDGALGMAFGQISSTLLISIGVPPAAASAGVHTAETFTTAVSGISHVAHRNVDWRLFFRLVIPGVIGGVLGAYVLTQIDAGDRQAVRARLSDRARPLPVLSRRHAPPHRAAAAGSSRRSGLSAASSMRPAAAAGARSSPPTCWSRAATRARRSAPSTPPNSSSP